MSSTELRLEVKLAHGILNLSANVPCLPESRIGFHYVRRDSVYYNCGLDPDDLEKSIEEALRDGRVHEDVDEHLSLVLSAAESLRLGSFSTEPRDQLGCMPTMQAEYDAWQKVVKEFNAIEENINNPKFAPLVRSIALWGEHLVALRIGQSANARNKAMTDAETAWNQAHQERSK